MPTAAPRDQARGAPVPGTRIAACADGNDPRGEATSVAAATSPAIPYRAPAFSCVPATGTAAPPCTSSLRYSIASITGTPARHARRRAVTRCRPRRRAPCTSSLHHRIALPTPARVPPAIPLRSRRRERCRESRPCLDTRSFGSIIDPGNPLQPGRVAPARVARWCRRHPWPSAEVGCVFQGG